MNFGAAAQDEESGYVLHLACVRHYCTDPETGCPRTIIWVSEWNDDACFAIEGCGGE
jgi:hypothetical protein